MNLSSPILILLIAQACLILSGCLAPKVGKKPALQLTPPTEWESNVSTTDKNRSAEGWAFQVGGDELNALVDRALSDNPSLLAMSERLIAQENRQPYLVPKSCPLHRPKLPVADPRGTLLDLFPKQHFFYEQQLHFRT